MQIYQNLYEENTCFNRFMGANFTYQGVNILLNDLPQFKCQFNLLNTDNLKFNWRYIRANQKFLFKSTDKCYHIIFKEQSINQQNLQYQAKFINKSDGYSVQLGLKYHYKKNPLRKHILIPQFQINLSPLEQNNNLDIGVKYNFYNYDDNYKIRTSLSKSIQNKSNFDYSMIGSFSKQEHLQLGLENNKFWIGTKFNIRKIDFHTLLHYEILHKRFDFVGFILLNQQTFPIQEKLKIVGGISTKKEILANISYQTKLCKFGYCLRWQQGNGKSMGYSIEI